MGQDTGNQGVGAYRAPARRAMKSLRIFWEDSGRTAQETLFPGRFRGLFRKPQRLARRPHGSHDSPSSLWRERVFSGGVCLITDTPTGMHHVGSAHDRSGVFFRGDIPLVIPVEACPWSLNPSPLRGESARQGRSPRILPVGGERRRPGLPTASPPPAGRTHAVPGRTPIWSFPRKRESSSLPLSGLDIAPLLHICSALFSSWFPSLQDTAPCLFKPFNLPHPNPLPGGEGNACPLMTAYPQNVSCLRDASLRHVMGEPWRHDPLDPCPARPCTDALDFCCSLSPRASIGGGNDREPAPAWFRQGAP